MKVGRRSELLLLAALAVPIALVVTSIMGTIDLRSMSEDEAYTYCFATDPWPRFVPDVTKLDAGIAFYYALNRAYALIFGSSAAGLRSFSLIFAVGSLAAIYILTRAFFSPVVSAISTILLLINSFWYEQAQNARAYSFALFLALVATIMFVYAAKNAAARGFHLLYVLTFTLLALTQFAVALSLLFAHFISFPTIPGRTTTLRQSLPYGLCVVAVLIMFGMIIAHVGLTLVPNSTPLSPELIARHIAWVFGRKIALLTFGCIIGSYFLKFRARHDSRLTTLIIWLAAPLMVVAVLAISNVAAASARYMLGALYPLLMLVGYIISTVKPAIPRLFVLLIAVGAEAAGIKTYFDEPWHDFNQEMRLLASSTRSGDVVAFSPPYIQIRAYVNMKLMHIAFRRGVRTVPTDINGSWLYIDQNAPSLALQRITPSRAHALWIVSIDDKMSSSNPCYLTHQTMRLFTDYKVRVVCVARQ